MKTRNIIYVSMMLPNLSTKNWSCWNFPGIFASWRLLENSNQINLGRQSRPKLAICPLGVLQWQLKLKLKSLKVSWHEIFLFQNMLPIDAFIKVAFLFFQVWSGNLLKSQIFKKNWSLKLGHGFPCCSHCL